MFVFIENHCPQGILETESVNIQSHEWNLFIESSLR